MKYAIYDKAADGYLTTMEFDTEVPDNYTRYALGYNEYITKARLLDTKEEAADVVTRTEGLKFMEKGRFVIHSFDDSLNNQYIISETGNPTKVVDTITVNLDGIINVKYGTMACHWSASSLGYVVNRLDRLQDVSNPSIYTAWRDTFDIYKVITIMDEKEHTHYQFINVTEKCLDFTKDEEESSLNKRIEELEKANYELGEQVAERGIVANRLLDENNSLKTKVEAIKKEARSWKYLYEKADADRGELKNVIDIIHTDLVSSTACDDLKDTLKAINCNSVLDHISMENFLTAKDEIRSIISHVITILESRELNQSVAFSAAKDVKFARDIANDIISICEADDKFEVTLKKFSQLHEAMNATYNTDDDPILHAFNSVLLIFTAVDHKLTEYFDEIASWENKAQKAEKALEYQKKLNDANKATIAYLTVNKMAKDKELSDWKRRAEEAIRDYTKCNEALGEWKRKYRTMREERDKALERAEKFKGIANSVYGYLSTDDAAIDYCLHDVMIIGGRCCGKQLMADILSGKKIPISKDKYESILTSLKLIDLSYEGVYGAMIHISPKPKPTWLPGLMTEIKNLTK